MYRVFEERIKALGITAYRVAKDTGISTVTLCDWKYGRSKPKVDKLKKIAIRIDIPLEELLKEDA